MIAELQLLVCLGTMPGNIAYESEYCCTSCCRNTERNRDLGTSNSQNVRLVRLSDKDTALVALTLARTPVWNVACPEITSILTVGTQARYSSNY